jgi:hypothetical protein
LPYRLYPFGQILVLPAAFYWSKSCPTGCINLVRCLSYMLRIIGWMLALKAASFGPMLFLKAASCWSGSFSHRLHPVGQMLVKAASYWSGAFPTGYILLVRSLSFRLHSVDHMFVLQASFSSDACPTGCILSARCLSFMLLSNDEMLVLPASSCCLDA